MNNTYTRLDTQVLLVFAGVLLFFAMVFILPHCTGSSGNEIPIRKNLAYGQIQAADVDVKSLKHVYPIHTANYDVIYMSPYPELGSPTWIVYNESGGLSLFIYNQTDLLSLLRDLSDPISIKKQYWELLDSVTNKYSRPH